jgi:hypothetical protein
MTYYRWARRRWLAAAITTSVGVLALVAVPLAPDATVASAAVTTTSSTTTTTRATTTTTHPTTTTTSPSEAGSDCYASVTGAALSRSGWSAGSNAPYSSDYAPDLALDNNIATRFGSNEPQAVGLYFEVNLGSVQTFDELSMVTPGSPTDYARDFELEVSDNASSWTPIASCTGAGSSEVVSFKAQTARYVKVVLTAANSTYWWSIDEFNLYYSNCATSASGSALGRSGWIASTNAHAESADPAADALDGNLATRYSSNQDQAAGLYFEVDMRSVQYLDEVAMLAPNSPTDYARGYEVQIYNGSSWATVATCTGTGNPEIVSFPTQSARYVRVVLTAADSSYWWSIDEFYVYTSVAEPTTTTTTTLKTSTTSVSASANPVTVGDSVTYTARVVPVPSGGTVTFYQDGSALAGCSQLAVNTSSGEASCGARYLTSGHYAVQAFFSGSGVVKPSGSAAYDEVVNLPAPGYWLATANGQVYGFGGAAPLGDVNTSSTTGPVVGIAGDLTGQGYWVVTANGTVSNFGDAKFFGDLPDLGKHVSDIVAIAPTSDGQGYYLVGADGGFFTFGDARFHGSLPGIHLHVKDIVGMVATPGGAGYLLVGSDGGVFTFGDSRFYGSLPGIHKHVHDIRAILPSSTGKGYILVGSDGGAFIFGTGVKFLGSLPGQGIKVANIVGIALTPDNGGYIMAGSDGHVYGFGDAQVGGEPAGLSSNLPVAAIAGT